MLTVRSRLRKAVLDTLHAAGIEIVSASFMNQRSLSRGDAVLPKGASQEPRRAPAGDKPTPEALIFDKAEIAEEIEQLRAERSELLHAIKELERQRGDADEPHGSQLEREVASRRRRAEVIDDRLAAAEQAQSD